MTGANGQNMPQRPARQGQPPHEAAQVSPYYAPPGAFSHAVPRRPSRWMAITALSIVIPAALLRFLPFIGALFILPVIVAMIFAVLALIVQRRGTGMSIAALVIGVVGLIVPVMLTMLRLGILGLTLYEMFQEGGW